MCAHGGTCIACGFLLQLSKVVKRVVRNIVFQRVYRAALHHNARDKRAG